VLDITQERPYSKMVMMINDVLAGLKIRGVCVDLKDNRHYRIYSIKLLPGQRIRRIESQIREIGLALKSFSTPTIEVCAEEGLLKIQITTAPPAIIKFDELYEKNKHTQPPGLLQMLLGESVDGEPIWLDLSKVPHLLTAGSTGSGKSVFVHTIIKNIEKRSDVLLYLSDPKSVEFNCYSETAASIAFNYNDTLRILRHLVWEQEERYALFNSINLRSIEDSPFAVPKIVFILDELADLMIYDKDKNNPDKGLLEKLLVQLAQKSRSIGIFLILSTQRPSIDILSGIIKANFPGRVACKVATGTDSRVILDRVGAECLAGRGDAILSAGPFENLRFQVAL